MRLAKKLKVSPDSYALYQYVQDNISSDTGERLSIMSQDINLKGYVTGIEISFCSTEFREVLGNPEAYTDKTIVRYPEILRIYLWKYLGIENYQ